MALDYGRRRIGVAISDATGTIASPHSVVRNSGDPSVPPDSLLDLLDETEPSVIVVGIPLEMDGSEGDMAREVRAFADELESRTSLPVVEWDERLSSEAARRSIREAELPEAARRDRGRTDMVAASLILRAYLASER